MSCGTYSQATPVLFGKGAVKYVGQQAKKMGMTNVLLVTDKGIVSVGHNEKVIDKLKEEGIKCTMWAETMPECPDNVVRQAADIAKKQKVDGIIGLGGGSSLDTAKAVSAVAANEEDILADIGAYLSGEKKFSHSPIPSILIPTTAGTGSESTSVAVINDTKNDIKIGLPVAGSFAIVDPMLTLGTPRSITAFSALDAFSHAYESITEINSTPHSQMLAYEAIRRITKWLPRACEDISDEEARENLSVASNFAGIAFAEAMVHIGHAIAHVLGHKYGLHHGTACALAMPPLMEFVGKQFFKRTVKVGRAMGIDMDGLDGEASGKAVANGFRRLMSETGIPTLKEKGITRDQVIELFPTVWNDPFLKLYAGTVDESDIMKMLVGIYDGYK